MSKFFLPYQARWITDPSRKRLMVKSRQIGISLSTAYDLVLKTGKLSFRFDTCRSAGLQRDFLGESRVQLGAPIPSRSRPTFLSCTPGGRCCKTFLATAGAPG
jgi:hypothetical protein